MADRIDDDVLVCRCEEVTAADIRKAIADGARDVTGVKLRTRAGMGLCQGRTCEVLVQAILRSVRQETLEDSLRRVIREELKAVPFQPVEQPEKDIPEQVLGFLGSLLEEDEP